MSSLCEPISAFTCSSPCFLLILSLLFISFVLGNRGEEKRVSLLFAVVCLMMDDSKRAAKAFVKQYFPVKEPNPKSSDVLGDIFPPSSKKESPTKQGGFGSHSLNAPSGVAERKFQGSSAQKRQSTLQKGSNAAEHCEISEPCLMSSSVDYGCRDNYPYNPDNRYPGPSYYIEKERKDVSEYAHPETGGAEWWQGSYYY